MLHSPILANEKQALIQGLVQCCCFVCWLAGLFSLSHISAYFAAKTQEINSFFLKEISTLPEASL